MSSGLFKKRLTKELRGNMMSTPTNISVPTHPKLRIKGAPNTLYEGEEFDLEFRFSPSYPLESPEVTFIQPSIPIHPHIYSNGHICLNILYKDWSPVQTVAQVCLSIQSMLSSCVKKELPPDNDLYVKSARASPKKTTWAFQLKGH
ncbi:ubiquitin-conjugating enzyme/RWD-like protein [Phycomyces nitens]|nr:ubiquitin-conjugating enzyme/RWD-like protein [Phycomyces nitens]